MAPTELPSVVQRYIDIIGEHEASTRYNLDDPQELAEALEEEQQRRAALEEQLQERQREIDTLRIRLQDGGDLLATLEAKEEELNRIKNEYAKKMKNTIALTRIKYEREIDKLRKDFKRLQETGGGPSSGVELASLRESVEAKEAKVARLQEEMASLKGELERAKAAPSASGARTEDLAERDEMIKDLQEELARAGTEREEAEKELQSVKKGSVAMMKYLTTLQQRKQEEELKNIREALDKEMEGRLKAEGDIGVMQARLTSREAELTAKFEELSKGNLVDLRMVKALEEELKKQREDLVTREQRLLEREQLIKEKIRGLETEIRKKLKDDKVIQDIKRELAQKEEEIRRAAIALKKKDEELKAREKKLKESGKGRGESAPESVAVAELQSQMADQTEQLKLQRAQLEARESELRAAQAAIASDGTEGMITLQTEISRLKAIVADKEREIQGIHEPLKFKEKEVARRDAELTHREKVLEEELRRTAEAAREGGTQADLRLKKRLQDVQLELDAAKEEVKQRESMLRQKETELAAREEALVKGELDARVEMRRAEFEEEKARTGNSRLDDLLYGGIPFGRQVLVMGPPFIGKETMCDNFLAAGVHKGIPALVITTDCSPTDLREEMKPMLPEVEELEKQGLIKYVDVYSMSMGIEEDDPNVICVESPTDYKAINKAVETFHKHFIEAGHKTYRMAVRSVSTLITYSEPQTTYRFLQVLTGMAKRRKAVAFYVLDKGMHSDQEIQALGHFMDGAIEFKTDGIKTFLMVQGVGDAQSRSWIQYQYTKKGLNIGSFSLDRIQ